MIGELSITAIGNMQPRILPDLRNDIAHQLQIDLKITLHNHGKTKHLTFHGVIEDCGRY